MTGTLPPLLDSVVGGGTPERSCVLFLMDLMLLCPSKGLVLPNQNVDDIAKHSRFLILSLANNEMLKKSPFAIQKAFKGIGGDPKSVRKLRSGDLLIETESSVQSKSFLIVKAFLDSTLIVTPHKSLNSSRGVISVPDLLYASETEIFEGLSDQGVTQCQRFGHSQASCRGQLTCSRFPLPESAPTTSNSENSNATEIPKCVKRNSRNRRKRPKVQKPEIEIVPHRPRKSTPTERVTDEEDMITYDVEEDELQPNPTDKFIKGKYGRNNLDKYLYALLLQRDSGNNRN
ncbi:putative RNA-directed DNA polymerase from transposon BS [Trichonephila clavipes]|nr:putative RNA-directed DNA polymerase from transposon BS [Trichonephila clavipes]